MATTSYYKANKDIRDNRVTIITYVFCMYKIMNDFFIYFFYMLFNMVSFFVNGHLKSWSESNYLWKKYIDINYSWLVFIICKIKYPPKKTGSKEQKIRAKKTY